MQTSPSSSPAYQPGRRHSAGLVVSTETLLAVLCVYWALAANRGFLSGARQAMEGGSGGVLLALLAMLALLHFLLLAPFMARAWARPLLAVLVLVAAVSSHFVQGLGAVLDPDMLRNALRTEWTESRELLTSSMLLHVLVQALPAWWLISQVRLAPRRSLWRATLRRALWWVVALGLFVALLMSVFQPFSSLMRNHKALRYQVVPAAPLWSLPRSLFNEAKEVNRERIPIGQDAQAGPSWATQQRPRVLVLVVGETVRAANWGPHTTLDGSSRNTAPLTGADPSLTLFPVVDTCGTNTEVSVPCMFAPVGRRDYDEGRIRGEQSLLHVLAKAGVDVRWLDNQSGCKGVCDGLNQTFTRDLPLAPGLCRDGQCLDDSLLHGLEANLAAAKGTQIWVLHMLGNHGPAYHRRVPEGFAPYKPICAVDDLGRCSRAEITNAFDNALRHTDVVLARLWQSLRAASQSGGVDTAMVFIPDHGESLGERGVYLHGLPYAIAPKEQTQVPMLMGLSEGFRAARGWSATCLKDLPQRVTKPQHDHLFHTVLSLLEVKTALYDPRWDMLAACPTVTGAAPASP